MSEARGSPPDNIANQKTDQSPNAREQQGSRSTRNPNIDKTGQVPKIGKKKPAETVSRPPRDEDSNDVSYCSPLLRAYPSFDDTDDQNDWANSANFMPFSGRFPGALFPPWAYFTPPHDDTEDHDDGEDDWGADPEGQSVENKNVRDVYPGDSENAPPATSGSAADDI